VTSSYSADGNAIWQSVFHSARKRTISGEKPVAQANVSGHREILHVGQAGHCTAERTLTEVSSLGAFQFTPADLRRQKLFSEEDS